MNTVVVRGARVLFVAWSAYLALLTCSFYEGWLGVERNRLDSAWMIAVALAVACALSVRETPQAVPAASWSVRPMTVLGIAAAAILYFPSFSIGLLSDDFTLLQRAMTGPLARVHDVMFRPAPVALWAFVVQLAPRTAVPVVLHLLNVGLHCVNAVLVAALGRRLGLSRVIAFCAAALFLTFPATVEAVAWASGVQDVIAAAGVLGFLCLLTGPPRGWSGAAAIALLLGALLAKESAIAGCVLAGAWLVLLDESRARAHRLWLCAAAAALTLAYVAWRVMLVGRRFDNQPSTTRRGIAHFLTSPFAALGSPWSSGDLLHWSLVGLVPALLLLAAIVAFVIQPRPRKQVVDALVLVLCVLISVAPVGRYFFIAPDLEGSRYLYLPSAFWALFIGYVLAHTTVRREALRVTVLTTVIAIFAVGVRVHLRSWELASGSRDALLASITEAVQHQGCDAVAIDDVPDNVGGAYVFRNGLPEALAMRGLTVRLVPANSQEVSAPCTVHPRRR